MPGANTLKGRASQEKWTEGADAKEYHREVRGRGPPACSGRSQRPPLWTSGPKPLRVSFLPGRVCVGSKGPKSAATRAISSRHMPASPPNPPETIKSNCAHGTDLRSDPSDVRPSCFPPHGCCTVLKYCHRMPHRATPANSWAYNKCWRYCPT